jgi:hypothetical protein
MGLITMPGFDCARIFPLLSRVYKLYLGQQVFTNAALMDF